MWNVARVCVVLASFVAAVGSATAPKAHDVQKTLTVHGDFESTWSALIDVFSDHSWDIDKIDKSSGIITTDWMKLDNDGAAYADCGSSIATTVGTQVRFNVRVKDDDDRTSVTVNAKFRQGRTFADSSTIINCESLGAVEALIQREVANRMPRHKHPKPTVEHAVPDAPIDAGALAPLAEPEQ